MLIQIPGAMIFNHKAECPMTTASGVLQTAPPPTEVPQAGKWPAKGIWGAMPSAEYVDAPREDLDSYHLHRWLEKTTPDAPYEEWFGLFAEKDEVVAIAEMVNALEARLAVAETERDRATALADAYKRDVDHMRKQYARPMTELKAEVTRVSEASVRPLVVRCEAAEQALAQVQAKVGDYRQALQRITDWPEDDRAERCSHIASRALDNWDELDYDALTQPAAEGGM